MGVSDDVPLAKMYGWHRAMRIFDGPDEVHLRSLARAELKRDHIAGPVWLAARTRRARAARQSAQALPAGLATASR